MPAVKFTSGSSDQLARKRGFMFQPRLEQLDDRLAPAIVSNLISREVDDSAGNNPFRGVDADVQVLGASDDGNFLLLQTAATNISKDYFGGPQISAPGQVNLFRYNVTSGSAEMISAFKAPAGVQSFQPGAKGLGVEVSTRDKLNAVISGDGQTIAFLSSANAFYFDPTLPQGLAADGGGTDVFVWRADPSGAGGTNTLASRTSTGVAIGGFGSVSNPTLSPDGTSVSFITSVPAERIMGLNPILTKVISISYNDPTSGILLPPASLILNDTNDVLVRDQPNSPDIFRAVIGKTPVPISYDKVNLDVLFRDANNKLVVNTVPRYIMHGNINVDPLNRYNTAGNARFVGIRDWNIYGGNFTTGDDAWLYGYDPSVVLSATDDPVTRTKAFTAKDLATIPGFNSIGNVVNAFLSQGSGDLFFIYQPLGKTNAGFLLPDYVNNNGGNPDMYRIRGASAAERPELLTNAAGTTNQGANGVLDVATPAAYQVNPDGTKLLFTSKATNLVTGVTDTNLAFDIFQRDLTNSPTTGGKTFVMSVLNSNPLVTGNADARYPTQTPDGLAVSFESAGTNFTPIPDANNATDIFVRDIVRGNTLLASATSSNISTPNAASTQAIVVRIAPIDQNFFRNFQVFYSSRANDIDTDYTIPPGLEMVYGTKFPIFISALTKGFAFSDNRGYAYTATTNAFGKVVVGTKYEPIPGYRGELRVASGDLNGDGVPDIVAGAGPGGGPRVVIIDGFNGRVLDDFFAFESSFRGGVYVAVADLTGDGKADLIVGAGEGGGPRVQVYDSITGVPLVDMFAYENTARTGVRVAAGDFNGDNVNDLFIAAGIGGGPRVRIFNGLNLPNQNVMADFFVFESGQRGGAYISAADYDGDGKADVVAGAGPDGGPRVRVINAVNLNLQDPNQTYAFVDFFAFDPNLRTGVRPILRDIDSDRFGDLIVGLGAGLPQVRTFIGRTIRPTGDVQPVDDIFAGGVLTGSFGAWVG